MHARTPAAATRAGWYRQPVLWLGALLFGASLAGCVWMIVLGARHADPPVPLAGDSVFKVPLAAPRLPPPAPSPARTDP